MLAMTATLIMENSSPLKMEPTCLRQSSTARTGWLEQIFTKTASFITSTLNDFDGGAGSLSVILYLEVCDEVYLQRPPSTTPGHLYNWAVSGVTGVLLQSDD